MDTFNYCEVKLTQLKLTQWWAIAFTLLLHPCSSWPLVNTLKCPDFLVNQIWLLTALA